MNIAIYHAAVIGTLRAALPAFGLPLHVDVNSTNPISPYISWATAANVIQKPAEAASDGDTVLVMDGVYATGGKAVYGTMTNRVAVDKALTLLSVNGPKATIIQGFQVPGTMNGDEAIRCVYLTNGAILSGFTLMAGTTRTEYEPAPLAQTGGGGVWSESEAGTVTNCFLIADKAHLQGGGACNGTLKQCTISSNSVTGGLNAFGGGVFRAKLSDCLVIGNGSVHDSGEAQACTMTRCGLIGNTAVENAGGAGLSTLVDCLVYSNSAQFAAGVIWGQLTNCTVVCNSAQSEWGGVFGSDLNNCIVYYNSAPTSANHDTFYSTFNYSSTTPISTSGLGNITTPPLFADTNGWADLRLQSNSPCINAGNNAYITTVNDLDGNPRIVGGTVDIGAYEFQSPQSIISYTWPQQYCLPTDGSVDNADSDNDKANTWQEWKAWTDPSNALSVLKMLRPQAGTNGVVVPWQSVSGHNYSLERAGNAGGAYSLLQANIPGEAGSTSYTDTTATNGEAFFYRVSVPE